MFIALAVCCGELASGENNPTQRAAVGALQLHGAGATFPAPLYKKWVEEYQKQHPDVQLSYKAIGSGEGIMQFMAGVVDFGASDAAMSDEEMAGLFAIIWAESKSLHNRPISFFSDCVHCAIQRPGVASV
jgi:ABC-type phosphate transport system substrate-binding protein